MDDSFRSRTNPIGNGTLGLKRSSALDNIFLKKGYLKHATYYQHVDHASWGGDLAGCERYRGYGPSAKNIRPDELISPRYCVL